MLFVFVVYLRTTEFIDERMTHNGILTHNAIHNKQQLHFLHTLYYIDCNLTRATINMHTRNGKEKRANKRTKKLNVGRYHTKILERARAIALSKSTDFHRCSFHPISSAHTQCVAGVRMQVQQLSRKCIRRTCICMHNDFQWSILCVLNLCTMLCTPFLANFLTSN